MLASMLRSRVQLQEKVSTQDSTGPSEVWKPVQTIYAKIIPLNVMTIASYQQLSTEVSHKVILRGIVTVSLGVHRILHGSKTYEPQSSAKHFDEVTEVIVREA